MNKHDMLTDYINVYMSSLKHLETLISKPTNEYGISFEQWLIMAAIAQRERQITMTEIAMYRGVTKGAVARQLKSLFEVGYVQQQQAALDKRRSLLVLTAKGAEIEKVVTALVIQRFDEWVDVYGLEDSQTLLEKLQRFDRLIGKTN